MKLRKHFKRAVDSNNLELYASLCLMLAVTGLSCSGNPGAFVNGEIHRIPSGIIDPAPNVYIYLPDNYEVATDDIYPVHYITDAPGQSNILYDLLRMHSHALVEEMPKCIVVGISSGNREFNLHPARGAGDYLTFLTDELIPYIEKKYRTGPFRSIAGHSLGGGFALYAFLSRPDLFNACIAGSPYPLENLSRFFTGNGNRFDLTESRFLYSSIGTVNDIGKSEFESFEAALKTVSSTSLDAHFIINENESHVSNVVINYQNGLEALYSGRQ